MIKLKTKKKIPEWTQVEHLFKFKYKDEKVEAQNLYERIKDIMSHVSSYEKHYIIKRDEIELYLLVPCGCVFQGDSYYLLYAFSLIYGFVYVKEKNKEYKFFGSPTMLFDIIEDFYICNAELDKYTIESRCYEIGYIFRLLLNSGMVEYFQDILCIRNGFHCNSCNVFCDENSYLSIEESNPVYIFNNDLKFIYCPFCGNPIYLNDEISEMIHSFKVLHLYKNLFCNDLYNEDFKLQYFAHINKKYADSKLLEDGYYESLDDLTYRELFGVTKHEFLDVWNLFSSGVYEKMAPYKNFKCMEKKYENGGTILYHDARYQENYDYLVENAARLIRERKLKQLFIEGFDNLD